MMAWSDAHTGSILADLPIFVLCHCVYCRMTHEIWRPVLGWEGWYEASSLGRVRAIQRPRRGGPRNFNEPYPLILTPLIYRKGYLKYRLGECNGTRKAERRFAHRIIYEAFHGPIPPGITVNHKDGSKNNNRPENLETATYQEQVTHARSLDLPRTKNGKHHHLTVAEVREIRRDYANGLATYETLAAKYGVVEGAIGHILKRRTWKHVP